MFRVIPGHCDPANPQEPTISPCHHFRPGDYPNSHHPLNLFTPADTIFKKKQLSALPQKTGGQKPEVPEKI
jgi:hypothetical protein